MSGAAEAQARVVRFDARGRFVKSYGVHAAGLADYIAQLAAEKHPAHRVEVQPITKGGDHAG